MASTNNHLFFILVKSTGNKIGDKGVTSLNGALQSNTVLTKLNLKGKCKKHIKGVHKNFFPLSLNQQETGLEKQEQRY